MVESPKRLRSLRKSFAVGTHLQNFRGRPLQIGHELNGQTMFGQPHGKEGSHSLLHSMINGDLWIRLCSQTQKVGYGVPGAKACPWHARDTGVYASVEIRDMAEGLRL
eukprot:15474854-Heterocapsa_arctica.AAC.1